MVTVNSPRETRVEDVRRWCEDAGWVRALAGQLVADATQADDLAQDAWIQAMRGPRPAAGAFRGWITRTLRNLAISQHRARSRRQLHEARVDSPLAPEDPETIAARLELHRELVTAVTDLGEPYRTVIALRYLDGLSPPEIAERTGRPLRTVHTQLGRALGQLRTRLDGKDPRWRALFLPFTLSIPAPPALLLLMMTKTKAVLAGVAAVCAIAFAVDAWSGAAQPEAPVDLPVARELSSAAAPLAPGEEHRELAAAPEAAPAAPEVEATAATTEAWKLSGMLLDVEARPVNGVAVCFRSFGSQADRFHGKSDVDGSFELTLPAVQGGHLKVDDPAWTTVYRAVLWGKREVGELTLVVAPTAPVDGTVVDETGRPLAGATIQIFGALPNRARFGRSLERALAGTWQVESDQAGRFTVPRAPVLPGMRIHASRRGHRTATLDLVERQQLRLELQTTSAMLDGVVVDANGEPTQASVWCGYTGVNTDEHGRFSIDLSGTGVDPVRGKHRWLIATRSGALPGKLRCDSDPPSAPRSWPQPLVLRLGGAPQTISGRVLFADGEPVPSPSVKIIDPEYLGDPSNSPGSEMSSVEFMARVNSRATEAGAEFSESSNLSHADRQLGGFEVRGLQDRPYRLLVEQRGRLQWMISEPIAAGSRDVVLHLPAQPVWSGLGGIIVDRRGKSVAKASIWFTRKVGASPLSGTTPLAVPRGTIETARLSSDADGRFQRGPLSRQAQTILVQAPGIAHGTPFDLQQLGDLRNLRLVVPVKTRARIAATPSSRAADSASFFDAAGTKVAVTITHGDRAWGAGHFQLVEGQSEAMTVPDSAVALVLFAKGKEQGRMLVELVPGEIQVIHPRW